MIIKYKNKVMRIDKLQEILAKHKLWVESKDGGERANLSGVDLFGANLSEATLQESDLQRATMQEADLSGANLSGANLFEANMYGANLFGANLFGADLRGADLRGSDLRAANLSGAYLEGAYLQGAKNVPYIPMACPDTGEFTAWKKAHGHIIKLRVPDDAKRSSATGRKCRCDKAKVIAIETIDGKSAEITEIASDYDEDFIYRIGETVSVSNFFEDRFAECAFGIHFFINRQEAVDYS